MKGRGVRVIKPDDLQSRHARRQGQGPLRHRRCRRRLRARQDRLPPDGPKKPSVAFDKLLQAVALGNTEARRALISSPDASPAWSTDLRRKMNRRISKASGGLALKDLSRRLVEALDPDRHVEQAKQDSNTDQPTSEQQFSRPPPS